MTNRIPWSITTTVRNPERLKDFLTCLQQYEGKIWDKENQIKYQISLIQHRLYGYGNTQFYNGLSEQQKKLIDNPSNQISFAEAQGIFEVKNYKDPAIRGRQSLNPLKKFGLVTLADKKIKITQLGQELLSDDSNMGEVLFKSFLKWQIPNPLTNDYKETGFCNIKPFIGVMHLINLVNKKEKLANEKAKGISKEEFCLFVPTLMHYEKIDSYAEAIVKLRRQIKGKDKKSGKTIFEQFQKDFVLEFLNGNHKKYGKTIQNLNDYGDNTIRYFRLTGYFHIRGNGFYIDLEPKRSVEIEALLKHDNAKPKEFSSKEEYTEYLSALDSYSLPWKERKSYLKIVNSITKDIRGIETKLNVPQKTFKETDSLGEKEFDAHIAMLRDYRNELQDHLTYTKLQDIENIKENNTLLKKIYNFENKALLLEKLSALGLYALNDAKKIKPNYPVGDDNEPTFTAPANMPDIECFYEDFNVICEVTMLKTRSQWYNEGQPVMRHLRDFEDKHSDKECYCLFIAPKIHRDTLNTFWNSVKYEFEGKKQKIIPLSISDFTGILDFLVLLKQKGKPFKQDNIYELYESIIDKSRSESKSNNWLAQVPKAIEAWKSTFDL